MRMAALACVGLLSILVIGCLTGARFNMTESLPKGLYWRIADPVSRDAYVRFCPPDTEVFSEARHRGYLHDGGCPGGYRALMKRVSGIAGDTVIVERDAIRINHIRLPWSAPLAVDLAGRPLPRLEQKTYVLTSMQLWVMSDTNGHSFDSRYFGPIDRSSVKEVVTPVLTWNSAP